MLILYRYFMPYIFHKLGTCEVGGLTPIQALEIVRGCRGMNLVGADLVEVIYTKTC